MWAFVSFIVYLWEQDKDDDDGLEQFVRRSVDANDIGWFPLNKAMCLESEEEDLRKDIGCTTDSMLDGVKSSKMKIVDTMDSIAMSLNSLSSTDVVDNQMSVQ